MSLDRRQFLTRAALLGGAAAAGGVAALGARRLVAGPPLDETAIRFHPDDVVGVGQEAAVWYRYKFTGQSVMDNQLIWLLGLATEQLVDVGEVIDTALRIQRGDEVGWFDAWLATSARVRAMGDTALAAGHERSAGSHYLRAGMYLRAGLLRYSAWEDPRIVQATRDTLDLHDRAMRLLGYDSQQVAIPYEGSSLVGRHYFARGVGTAPTVLMHQGLHAWPEDTMWVVNGALERGYHVLALHGPGQGASLRLHGHPFRPDWEHAIAPVLDHMEGIERFDSERVILMGLSFGGFLAPRAAAAEHRIHTLVADPGVLDWGASMMRHFNAIPGLMGIRSMSSSAFDSTIAGISTAWPDAAWYFEDATRKHGVGSPHALIADLERYENHAGAPNIRCRTLIMDGAAEDATPGQSKALFDALTCDKHLMTFDAAGAAQTHCQAGGQIQAKARLYDWLDDHVGRG